MIKLLEVTNPLQPSVDRIDRELDHVEGETLEDLLRRCFEAEAVENLTVSLNGRILPSDYWFATTPRDGDCIVVVPKVQNPSLARTLGTLAIAAASIALIASGVGAPLGAALGFSGTTALAVGNGIVASAVSIGGGFIVSAIVSALTPSQKQQTPSYAFDGPHSLAQSGTVIPKGDGTMRWGGNVIASFIDIEGKDQFINALACYGFGPARSITEIQINGKDISEYGNVQYYTRLGTNDQGPIPNFNRIVNGYPQTTQLLAAQPVVVPGTGTLTQILQVDVVAQSGLWELTSLGHLIVREVTYLVEYAVAGSGAWQPVFQPRTTVDIVTFDPVTGIANPFPTWVAVATDLPPGSGVVYATSNGSHFPGQPFSATQSITFTNPDASTHSTSKTVTGEWQLTNPQLNQVEVTDWSAGYILFSGASQSPVYNRTNIYGLAPGKYDVRVTKYGSGRNSAPIPPGDQFSQNFGQDIWLHSVNEVALLDLAYPNMILIGVRALATGQLSGSQINITALIQHGLRTLDNNILPGALQAYEEDNPACIAADMMLDGLYGGGQSPGISEGNILRFIDEWVDWANLNDELVDDGNGGSIRRHVFNGVFDNESNLWDQLGAVGRMSRAQIIPLGRDYGVFVDKDDDPVQIFTMGNIVQDSFTETWLLIDDRANQIEIQFADSTRFYKQDNPIVYMDPANQDSGVPIKNVRIDGKGITLPAQAWHLARFKERGNQFLLRTGSFKTDTDGIASRPGNVIGLQHDVPQWGWGGRTLPGSTTISIAIDRTDVPFAGGTSYSLILLFPALSRYTGTITSVATVTDVTGATTGTQLNLSSFDNADRVTRAVVVAAGVTYDCPITSAAAGMVVIQPVPGFTPAAGQAYTLYDTDVLITSPVTGANATTVTLGTPLPAAPPDFSTWFYGPVGSLKLVRIVNIRKASEYRSTIEWIDKDSRVYVDGTPIIGETSAQITSNPGVTSLVGKEVLNLVSGSYIPYASLSWQLGPDTVGVSIYAQVVGSPIGQLPEMIARLTNFATSFQVQIAPNQATVYTVVGFDLNNHYAGFKSAPSVTVNGLGPTPNLLLNSNFSEGLAFWTATPRAGDTLVPDLQNGGESTYTVAGTDLTTSQVLLAQPIPPSEWAVGDYLMLSAYFMDTAVSTANIGLLEATITFLNASGGTVGTVNTVALLGGGGMVRVNTDSTQIPAGTAGVLVTISVAPHVPSGLHIHVGSTLSIATLLLEKSTSTQTAPGIWSGSPAGSQISTYTNVPQFALTQPTPTTIALAAVAVTFGNLVANYSARTFTIPTPSADTWYYVTIADAAQAGETGAVLSATCSTSFALAGVQGQTYMGAILAVAAGGSIRPQPGGWPVPNSLQVGV
jgi:sulfur carrier protein ThiS